MSVPRLCTESVRIEGNYHYHEIWGKYPLHPISCLVTEALNGEFELEMDIEANDKYFPGILIGRIIVAPHDSTGDDEYFEVYNITNELNGIAHVSAWHISYRTQGMLLRPFSITSDICPSHIFQEFPSYILSAGENFFYASSDINTTITKPFVVEQVKSMREVIKQVIDTFGGELQPKAHTLYLYEQRGETSGVTLQYGINIISMTREQTNEDVFVGIYPFWHGKDSYGSETTVTLPEKFLTKSYLDDYYNYYKPIIPLDLSDYFETIPTVTELRNTANTWLNKNAPKTIPENIDISVLQADSEGKSKIAKLNLADTLIVNYPDMGIDVTAKVTKVVFNVLLDRYESISIGTTKNMNTAIKKVVGIR